MNIKISDIQCVENRQKTDTVSISELAKNIGAVGLLNPITLKRLPMGEKHLYKVVAGRRRFQALRMLEKEYLVEGKEYQLTDNDEDMVAFCENFHRASLTILEELTQLKELERKFGTENVAFLARELGKTEIWVRRRVRLLNLSKKWSFILQQNKYPVSFLEEVGKYSPEVQDQIPEYALINAKNAGSVAQNIARELCVELPKIHWPECDTCPKNPATETLFFSNCPASCTDGDCRRNKMAQDLNTLLKHFRDTATPVYISTAGGVSWRDREYYEKKFKINCIHGFSAKKDGKHNIILIKEAALQVIKGDVFSGYLQYAVFADEDMQNEEKQSPKIDPNERIKGKQIAVALCEFIKYLQSEYSSEEILQNLPNRQLRLRALILKYGYRAGYNNDTPLEDFHGYIGDEVFFLRIVKNLVEEIKNRLHCIHRDHTQLDLIHCLKQIKTFAFDLNIDFENKFFEPAKKKHPLKKNN